MKKISLSLLFLLLLSGFTSLAQEEKQPPVTLTKTEGSGFTYEKIIDLPGISKEDAYARVKQWILANVKTVDNNISFDDKDKNSITTSAALLLEQKTNMFAVPFVEFKISIGFKENKMRITATQFIIGENGQELPFESEHFFIGWPKKYKESCYKSFDEKFPAMITAMTAAAMKKDDKW